MREPSTLFQAAREPIASYGVASARDHLEGLRRGVLFLLAVGTALFLFVSVGWRSQDLSARDFLAETPCVGQQAVCASAEVGQNLGSSLR